MKAILEFNLNDEDDAIRYKHCNNSIRYLATLWNIAQIRSYFKYDDKVTADMVLERIDCIFAEDNINIDELS
jgi:hypothetical protein